MTGPVSNAQRRRVARSRHRVGRRRVAQHLPVGRRGDREANRRLEVGLVEHRVHAVRLGDRELGVEVHGVVDGIDEAVQALARVRVARIGDDAQLIVGGELLEADAGAVADHGGVDRPPVERQLVDGLGAAPR